MNWEIRMQFGQEKVNNYFFFFYLVAKKKESLVSVPELKIRS